MTQPSHSNAYLHLQLSCMQKYKHSVDFNDVILDFGLRQELSDGQLAWLHSAGVPGALDSDVQP